MTLTGKTVLVTGATGFLGGALARCLARDGVQVKALARRPNRDRYIMDIPNLEIVMGDITDSARMDDIIQGCDIVFHVAAALGGSLQHQQTVNVEGTRNVITACAKNNVQRVVHISTISVYGYKYKGDVTEATLPNPGNDAYHISKYEAEQVIQKIGGQQNLSYSIIRPGMIYGAHSSMWTKTAFSLAKRNPTIFIGNGGGSAFPIYIEDVVDLAITCATHPNAHNETFNCTPDPSPTFREYLGAYSQLAGHHRWFGIPHILIRPFTLLISLLAPKHTPAKDLNDILTLLGTNITYRMDKAQDLLDWQPKTTLAEGIKACEPYLRDIGLLK